VKARDRFIRALFAVALGMALPLMAACATSEPQPTDQITQQARTMTPLQIQMSKSIGTRMSQRAQAEKWTARPGAITLHDNVIVVWTKGRVEGAELAGARALISEWLQGYQGSGINKLEFKDYTSGADYGQYPAAAAAQ
jgi:hypothetical protein